MEGAVRIPCHFYGKIFYTHSTRHMKLNRIQIKIFEKLSKENDMDADDYIKQNSMEFINVQRDGLLDLSEEEGDIWIHKAYLLSL